MNKRVLNVGGNNKAIPLPEYYRNYNHHLLDIDPAGQPDIVADARSLFHIPRASYDAIYCSHNLEHYIRHHASQVLTGFWHIIKPSGFVEIRVPDLLEVMERVVRRGLDLDSVLYRLVDGQPILVHDVLYGFGLQMEASGEEFYAHRCGFSLLSLQRFMFEHGFPWLVSSRGSLEVRLLAFKKRPSKELLSSLQVEQELLVGGKKYINMSTLASRACQVWDSGNHDCAAAMSEIVLHFNKKNIELELILGEYALQKKEYSYAIEHFKNTLSIDCDSLQANIGLCRAFKLFGDAESMSEHLNKLMLSNSGIGAIVASLVQD